MTIIYTGSATNTNAYSSNFTVPAGGRASITFNTAGDLDAKAKLIYSGNNEAVIYEHAPVVLYGLNNSVEIAHAGSYKFEVINPRGNAITIDVT